MKRLFVDLSLTAQTGAGSAIYAWEICHRLMRLGFPLQILPMTSPFRTWKRDGIPRKIQALLRDLAWRPFLAGLEACHEDCFLFTNAFVPRRFQEREYGVIILDLGAWHDRDILSWRGRAGTRAIPRALAGARHVFAISEYTAQDISKMFKLPRGRITIAPCGLSESFIRQEGRTIREIKGIRLPDCYILHVGSHEPKKNIGFLLDVFHRLRTVDHPAGKKCKLLLTGAEYWRSQNLHQAIATHPFAQDIVTLGRVDQADMPALYGQAKALVFPSTLEGFGLPVIEALSQGTPALVQNNSSLSQFASYGAILFDMFDAELWANCLLEIISGNVRVADDHVQAVRQTFDWDQTAKTLYNVMLGK